EHVFYLKHDDLFLLESPSYIELKVKNTHNAFAVPETVRLLGDRKAVEWEFYSGGQWVPFDGVYGGESAVRLSKRGGRKVEPLELFGETGLWLRCRAHSLDERNGVPKLTSAQLDSLSM